MTEPRRVYENILSELANELDDLERKVYELLRDNPAGLDRYELVHRIYGYIPVTIDNPDDRKIRKAIERLRLRLFPILSTSGKAGYRLGTDSESVGQMIAELQSRRAKLDEQIEAASKFYSIPTGYTEDPVNVTQMEMAL